MTNISFDSTNSGFQAGIVRGSVHITQEPPISALGLAGLFNISLEIVDKLDSWENFRSEHRPLAARFKALKSQLESWGQVVGFDKSGPTLSQGHADLLDDQQVSSKIQDLLEAIGDICGYDENNTLGSRPISNGNGQGCNPVVSSGRNFGLASDGTVKRQAQFQQLSSIVTDLHRLIPMSSGTSGPRGYEECTGGYEANRRLDGTFQDRETRFTEFKRIMSLMEREYYVKMRRDLQKWLLGDCFPDGISDSYESRKASREKGTCDWILDRAWFLEWSSPEPPEGLVKVLWINGPAGFGKSVLGARMFDHLSSSLDGPVAHFFFTSDFERNNPFVRTGADDSVLGFMRALRLAVANSSTRLMILSRDEPEIRTCLSDYVDEASVFEYSITAQDVQPDLMLYSQHFIKSAWRGKSEQERLDLSKTLTDRSNGQFLWIKLQMTSMSPYDWTSRRLLEQAIAAAPMRLEDTYQRNWIKILERPERVRNRAMSLLRWIVFSLRPLKVQELAEALLISEDCDDVLVNETPDYIDTDFVNNGILGCCGSLLDIRKMEGEHGIGVRTVHLAHFTVKQYLLGNFFAMGRLSQLNNALECFMELDEHTLLAKMCLRYLNCLEVWQVNRSLEDGPSLGLFLNYAAESWHKHALAGNKRDSDVVRLVNQLFDTRRPNWNLWRQLFDINASLNHGKQSRGGESKGSSPVHYAAQLGLVDTLRFLIHDRKHDIDEKGVSGQTALLISCERGDLLLTRILLENGADFSIVNDDLRAPIWCAAQIGNADIVKLLIESGADITVLNGNNGTAVNVAADHGHLEVVKILIEKGINIRIANKQGWTPVISASSKGHLEVVRVLLENGADITVPNNNGWISVYLASQNGHLEVVKLLLQNGADITVTSKQGWTPVNSASLNGHLAVVKLLIENKADITITNDSGCTPVHFAAYNNHLEVLKLLLENGADITVTNKQGWTPVNSASLNGHLAVVKLLLENKADITITNDSGYTPVHSAAYNNHLEVLKLLLDNGADITVASNSGWTPVHSASLNGHLAMVKLLLENGADITVTDHIGWTSVHSASFNNHLKVVELLLENGASITVAHNDGWTPVHSASQNGHLAMVKLLLENRADVTVTNKQGWTPLSIACRYGHLEVAKLLLEKGADIAIAGVNGWTPLSRACEQGYIDIVKLLLENGADVAVALNDRRTPVHIASQNGHLEVVKLLFEKGADIAIAGIHGWTPLNRACEQGHIDVVKFLLENGADATVASNDGWTPVHSATRYNHLKALKLLLENGADITVSSNMGRTPLNIACRYGHLEVAKLLLEKGADVTVTSKKGWTPISGACRYGHLEVAKLLLEKRADFAIAGIYGWTPLSRACKQGYVDIVKLLLENGADVAVANNDGKTPVYIASHNGHVEVVKLLLENGADITATSKDGRTPVDSASKKGHLEVVKLLLDYRADATNNNGWMSSTPASQSGPFEVAKLLLENDKDGAMVMISDETEEHGDNVYTESYHHQYLVLGRFLPTFIS
ncbi:uncharacterized protein N7503_003921 [Penicillium pulvis]|uniref:uncharacterized protein n=1 Tax=Penicillium pulvis TaxID=1562058 RepID=UPI00254742FB|nr:uncharacterized protein N7503_003921 [Penicillium pulvis]KAJ5806319.1 hypothetical protein N7503_003921 [Penicillium pulvis]